MDAAQNSTIKVGVHSQIQEGIEWMQHKTVLLRLECRMFPKGSCV